MKGFKEAERWHWGGEKGTLIQAATSWREIMEGGATALSDCHPNDSYKVEATQIL